jgi:hypothetical protein
VRVELTEALLELPASIRGRSFSRRTTSKRSSGSRRHRVHRPGRLVFAEAIESLLARFRAIEVIFPDGTTPAAVAT